MSSKILSGSMATDTARSAVSITSTQVRAPQSPPTDQSLTKLLFNQQLSQQEKKLIMDGLIAVSLGINCPHQSQYYHRFLDPRRRQT